MMGSGAVGNESSLTGSDARQRSAELRDRYEAVRKNVRDAAARVGRANEEIVVVAVSKYAEVEDVHALARLGHRDFGENTVQQLIQRAAMLDELLDRDRVLARTREGTPAAGPAPAPGEKIRWHLIGHLQRNKARKAMELCRLIHSVDTLRLAEELQQLAMKKDERVDVLLQVNCSEEEAKNGCPLPAARFLAEQIDTMIEVRLRGLMTMGPLPTGDADKDRSESRRVFERCAEIFDDIRRSGVGDGRFDILSMGMSGDYDVAIECGSNLVRVGSAIFGERQGSGGGGDDERTAVDREGEVDEDLG